jgi:hypothetical protein
LVTGTGIALIAANVNAVVDVQAYDTTPAAKTSGGDYYFIEVNDYCTVGSSFYCEPSTTSSNIFTTSGPLFMQMTDNSDGTYSVTYSVKYSGLATMNVYLAKIGGFYGEYFNNAFLDGTPTTTSLDSYIDYDWSTGLITP